MDPVVPSESVTTFRDGTYRALRIMTVGYWRRRGLSYLFTALAGAKLVTDSQFRGNTHAVKSIQAHWLESLHLSLHVSFYNRRCPDVFSHSD
jgi:hypothetical protein